MYACAAGKEVQPIAIYRRGRVIGMLQKERVLISEYTTTECTSSMGVITGPLSVVLK